MDPLAQDPPDISAMPMYASHTYMKKQNHTLVKKKRKKLVPSTRKTTESLLDAINISECFVRIILGGIFSVPSVQRNGNYLTFHTKLQKNKLRTSFYHTSIVYFIWSRLSVLHYRPEYLSGYAKRSLKANNISRRERFGIKN